MRKYFSFQDDGFMEKSDWHPDYWVDVEKPDDDDFRFLTQTLKVPESFLEDIEDIDELPRVETEGNWLLTIIRIPVPSDNKDGAPFKTLPIGVITNKMVIATVCSCHSEVITSLIKESKRKKLHIRNYLDLILRIVFASTDWFLKYLRQINFIVESSELELRKSIRNEDLIQLRNIQKTLVYFNTAIRGNQVMTDRLKTIYQETDSLDIELLEDLVIEIKQAFNTVNVYTEILNGTMDSYTSIISNNLNVIMKRMTGFSIALMIPTGIASFYGMNLQNHVENAPWAFWAVVGFSCFCSALAILWFRRIKWF